jgi:hypothetical protein
MNFGSSNIATGSSALAQNNVVSSAPMRFQLALLYSGAFSSPDFSQFEGRRAAGYPNQVFVARVSNSFHASEVRE